jgi:hypothetical protein
MTTTALSPANPKLELALATTSDRLERYGGRCTRMESHQSFKHAAGRRMAVLTRLGTYKSSSVLPGRAIVVRGAVRIETLDSQNSSDNPS